MSDIQVRVGVVGSGQPRPEVKWPDGWPVPRVDDEVQLGDDIMHVRHVCWYPQGASDEFGKTPYVYVVIGPRRAT